MMAYGPWRTRLGPVLFGGLAFVLAGCAGAPAITPGPPRADAPDLVALHDAKSPTFDKNCLGCHGDIMTRTTLNPQFKEAHAVMIPFAPGYDAGVGVTDQTCTACHATVDILQHSGASIRKNVDARLCAMCHSRSGPASKKFYAN